MTAPRAVGEGLSGRKAKLHGESRGPKSTAFYKSKDAVAKARSALSVSVDLSVGQGLLDWDAGHEVAQKIAAASAVPGEPDLAAPKLKGVVRKAIGESLKKLIESRFEAEFEKMVAAYRAMLRESLAKGDDKDLQTALNKARLQEKILASTSMADQAQVCKLLGLSTTNPSATLKRREDKQELLRFTVDGRAAYPLFQFHIEERKIKPVIARLIAVKPADWSNFRLLYWLTRPHAEFDGPPAAMLGHQDEKVMAAFQRESLPIMHG